MECSSQSYGSVFTGLSLNLFDGTPFIVTLSRTGSPRGFKCFHFHCICFTISIQARHFGYNDYELLDRYEKDLPGVDIFVCTADPEIEPPTMVINTVLSMMAYDYPPEKLSVYLSDDGGSVLTFYAMLEASRFSKHWLPFCKNFKIQPRSPEAYFRTALEPLDDPNKAEEWLFVKVNIVDFMASFFNS